MGIDMSTNQIESRVRSGPRRMRVGISSAESGALCRLSSGGGEGAGGAAAASTPRPPAPRLLPHADREARGRVGAEFRRPLQARRRARLRAGLLYPDQQPSESSGTERLLRLEKGVRGWKQPGLCSGVPRLESLPSQHLVETEVWAGG